MTWLANMDPYTRGYVAALGAAATGGIIVWVLVYLLASGRERCRQCGRSR